MSRYRIEVSERAARDIEYYTRYIQKQSGSITIGLRWAESVVVALGKLEYQPTRFQIADEQIYCDYEVRRLLIGKYLAIYHVDERALVVTILSFRHGSRLPQRSDVPPDPPSGPPPAG